METRGCSEQAQPLYPFKPDTCQHLFSAYLRVCLSTGTQGGGSSLPLLTQHILLSKSKTCNPTLLQRHKLPTTTSEHPHISSPRVTPTSARDHFLPIEEGTTRPIDDSLRRNTLSSASTADTHLNLLSIERDGLVYSWPKGRLSRRWGKESWGCPALPMTR